jgi:hypothetical protein
LTFIFPKSPQKLLKDAKQKNPKRKTKKSKTKKSQKILQNSNIRHSSVDFPTAKEGLHRWLSPGIPIKVFIPLAKITSFAQVNLFTGFLEPLRNPH